ncbi:MAG: toprim domain-containing protein [Gemmatimonadaceae bacterium]
MTDSIAAILADANIRLRRQTPAHTEQVICPTCGGGSSREPSLTVTIDRDGAGATWLCHRGSCGWKGGQRVGSAAPVEVPRRTAPPPPHPAAQTEHRPDWLFGFFSERRIGARTVQEFGVYAVERRFPPPVGDSPAIVFPYRHDGKVVNRKYRPHPAKNPQLQERDALPTLFNVERLGDAPTEIVFVEGEPDVMALFECGVPHAVTLKDGAPAQVSENSDKRFAALATHADTLAKARRCVLAGDMDAPGLALREELARRLGRHRCWLVTWPKGCKDACDTLRAHGPDVVLALLKEAQPYPIDGLQRIKAGTLLALRQRPPPSVLTTGARATDAILKLPTEGRLIVLTGYPGSGKTAWARFVMVHTASDHARRWAVFSPEMQPWEHFAAECAEVFSGKPFWPQRGIPSMSDAEIGEAEQWLGDRVTMLVCDAEDDAPTLEWIIERARAAVLRDGATDLLIDPWNEIDHQRPDRVTETDHIGRGLQRLKAFGLRHGCNVWIIAHPAKPIQLKPGEKRAPPGPYDISGSAHWANKTDLGLTVHAPEVGKAEVHIWKTRFRRWGQRGTVAGLEFDVLTGRYTTPVPEMEPAGADHWTDR